MITSKICLTFFVITTSVYALDDLPEVPPCSVKDNECLVDFWQDTVKYLSKGSKSLNIAPLDPLKIENMVIDVPKLVYMKFDGLFHGFQGCIFDTAKLSLKKGSSRVSLDLHCDVISIKGHYNASANTTFLFGKDGLLQADGDGKVKLENLKLTFLMDCKIIKDNEGVLKFILKDGPFAYKYKIGGPVKFSGNNVYFGNEDISSSSVSFMNANWKFVMEVFGGPFFNKAMETISDLVRVYLSSVPASTYFLEDLDDYAMA